MVDIVSRRAAGLVDADPKRVVYTTWGSRIGVAWHYSQGSKHSTPRDLQAYAMNTLKYSDTHYNFFVDYRGIATEGRGWLVVGGHALYQNTPWIGICFIGYDADVTPEALATMRALFDEAERRKGAALQHKGHGELPGQNTNCPGNKIRDWNNSGMPGGIGGDDMYANYKDVGDKVTEMQIDVVTAGGRVGSSEDPRNDCDGHFGDNTAAGLAALLGPHVTEDGKMYGPWQRAELQRLLREKAAREAVAAAPAPGLPASVTLHLPGFQVELSNPAQDIVVPLSAS